jgi:hypothetical protein
MMPSVFIFSGCRTLFFSKGCVALASIEVRNVR